MTDWNAFRKCPVCRAKTGDACTLTKRVMVHDGAVDFRLDALEQPHTLRQQRTGYRSA